MNCWGQRLVPNRWGLMLCWKLLKCLNIKKATPYQDSYQNGYHDTYHDAYRDSGLDGPELAIAVQKSSADLKDAEDFVIG